MISRPCKAYSAAKQLVTLLSKTYWGWCWDQTSWCLGGRRGGSTNETMGDLLGSILASSTYTPEILWDRESLGTLFAAGCGVDPKHCWLENPLHFGWNLPGKLRNFHVVARLPQGALHKRMTLPETIIGETFFGSYCWWFRNPAKQLRAGEVPDNIRYIR